MFRVSGNEDEFSPLCGPSVRLLVDLAVSEAALDVLTLHPGND